MNIAVEELKKILDFNVLSTRGEVKLAPDNLDWSRCRPVRLEDGTWSPIKEHAKIGVRALLANPYFLLFDEMGTMKTAQVIIAAQFLFYAGLINRVIVVTPNNVKDVWFDKEIGELSLHLFNENKTTWAGTEPIFTETPGNSTPSRISEYHNKIRQWDWGDWTQRPDQLRWIVTNYEFIARSKERQKQLKNYCGIKTLLVIDESSAIKNKSTEQSKACLFLRRLCGRIVELNGTPIADTVIDLMNQANLAHPSILDCPYITTFRERYCDMNPHTEFPQVIGFKNLDDIQRRMAPYVLRRLKEQCVDLPPELPYVEIPVPLTPPNWKTYKTMRDDLVSWVSTNQASIANQAITKVMRLAQITSGFIGGVEEVFEELEEEVPEFMKEEDWFLKGPDPTAEAPLPKRVFRTLQFIGREKLDALMEFYGQNLERDPAFKLVAWCLFKPELHRVMEEFQKRFPQVRRIATIEGGQKKSERTLALRLLHPRTCVRDEPAFLGGTYGTGAMGHNFTGAHVMVNVSWDYSLFKFQQGNARIHRPGQTKAVSRYDFVATGPDGQKTIDHTKLKIRKGKEDVAKWTAKAWLDAEIRE